MSSAPPRSLVLARRLLALALVATALVTATTTTTTTTTTRSTSPSATAMASPAAASGTDEWPTIAFDAPRSLAPLPPARDIAQLMQSRRWSDRPPWRVRFPSALTGKCPVRAPNKKKSCRKRRGKPKEFDFFVLQQFWAPQSCASQLRRRATARATPGACPHAPLCDDPTPAMVAGLVVHGLWPQYVNGSYPMCCADEPMQQELWTAMGQDLHKTWPDVLHSPVALSERIPFLHFHEWIKHGTCSGLTQRQYFATTLDLAKRLPTPRTLLGRPPKRRAGRFEYRYGGLTRAATRIDRRTVESELTRDGKPCPSDPDAPCDVVLECASGRLLRSVNTCWTLDAEAMRAREEAARDATRDLLGDDATRDGATRDATREGTREGTSEADASRARAPAWPSARRAAPIAPTDIAPLVRRDCPRTVYPKTRCTADLLVIAQFPE